MPNVSSRSRTLRPGRGACAALAAVAAGALLAACGGGADGGSDDGSDGGAGASPAVVLDESQVEAALLTIDDLPDGWAINPDASDVLDGDDGDGDGKGGAPGCLGEVEDGETFEPLAESSVEFEVDDGFGVPALSSSVATFASEDEVSDQMDKLREVLSDCDPIDYTDPDDGTQISLTFETDDEPSSPDVDEQLNLTATGTISSGLEFPFSLWMSVARIGNNTTSVMITDLGDEAGEALDPYTAIAVDRLLAVLDGQTPEATPGPPIGGGLLDEQEPSDAPSTADFEQFPLDGGSYTWDSRVTLRLTVDRVEPWGRKDDFCGDGSCGVAHPDDIRVVLKYEVIVPEDAPEPFDAFGCPGVMYPTGGNDEEALGSTFGEYSQPISGKVFPGETKTGYDEYYVDKDYADREFYIESSCGDVDLTGETAYFVGSFG